MIARKSSLIIGTKIANGALGYVILFFITRHMRPEAYGILAFAYSFVALFKILGDMGFNRAHVKRISEGKNLGTCNGTFIASKMGLAGLMSGVVIGVVLIWKLVLGRGFESPTHEMAIYLMLGYWAVHQFAKTFTNTFRGKKQIAKSQIPNLFEMVVRAAVTVYVALSGYGAIALVLTYIAGDAGYLLVSAYFFKGNPIKRPSKSCLKSYWKFALPIIIVTAMMLIMTNIDKVLIQLFWRAEDVGYYFAAFRMSRFINMFTASMGALLLPTFSRLHAKNNIGKIRDITRRSERYLSMLVFPIVFGIISLANPTVFILLSNWRQAVAILLILPLFPLMEALSRPFSSQLTGMNRPKLMRNRALIMVGVNIVLNLVLIPKDIQSLNIKLAGMGAVGAAVATVIAYGIGLVYSRYAAYRLTGAKGNPRILLHLLSAGVMGFTLHWLNTVFVITRWYHLLAFGILGLGIYFALLALMGEFTRKDWDFFLDTLNVRKMVNYIKEEIRS